MKTKLPIDDALPSLTEAARARGFIVLRAPPGTGKTTRVPPALLDAGVPGTVVVVEPRQVAARASARRVAEERGGAPGDEVGWRVRFDDRTGPRTRLVYATDGVVLRALVRDPLLDGVGALVLDEFHERRLDTDLVLGLARRLREARPELVVVVMSATLDDDPARGPLAGAAAYDVPGVFHPVAVSYAARPDPRPDAARAAELVPRALASCDGDVLVFLPGVREIEDARALLSGLGGVDVLPLHGRLPPDEQDRALRPGRRRRVVLATNVAETSVTVDGVRAVIDTGTARVDQSHPQTGIDRLDLVPIATASADQRAGRAGRQGPGICFRAWTLEDHLGRPRFERPEVARKDPAGACLLLLAAGEPDLDAFPWPEPPAPHRLSAAMRQLEALGAVAGGRITPIGHQMAGLPLQPRLARMVLEAARLGHAEPAARLAALLADRYDNALLRAGRPPTPSDVVDLIEASPGRDRATDAILRRLPAATTTCGLDEAIGRAVLAGWPDRVAARRGPSDPRGVLANGRGVVIAPPSAMSLGSLFCCVDVEDRAGSAEARVRLASMVAPEWLTGVVTRHEARFDPARDAVTSVRVTEWRGLVLDVRPAGRPEPDAAAEALERAARAEPARALALDRDETAALRARVETLRRACPELGLPGVDLSALTELLPELCVGAWSFEDLRGAVPGAIRARLDAAQRRALEVDAPERVTVPSGRSHALVWSLDGPPHLEVKMQELFGCGDTPTVCRGRVRVVLHLLAPNGRAQQVTDDLRGFWERTWPDVRKELRGRYPRHPWPEDPWTAPPTARAAPRR
jgi:ATP-dependent helicase HrpB